jgi:hypothetical protein
LRTRGPRFVRHVEHVIPVPELNGKCLTHETLQLCSVKMCSAAECSLVEYCTIAYTSLHSALHKHTYISTFTTFLSRLRPSKCSLGQDPPPELSLQQSRHLPFIYPTTISTTKNIPTTIDTSTLHTQTGIQNCFGTRLWKTFHV